MKSQKLFLEPEKDDDLTVGLVRLAKDIQDYELFYHINKINDFEISRIDDITIEGTYFTYQFPRFQGYHHLTKTCFQFIANKSSESIQKKGHNELFLEEESTRVLFDYHEDVDYILKTSDLIPDFSLILLPENLVFVIQDFRLSSEEELYQLIQYYE